jgi:hypothetical protein
MAASSSLKRMLVFLTAFTILNVVHATPTMARPANVSAPAHSVKTEEHPIVHEIHKRATGKVSIGGFVSFQAFRMLISCFSILYQLGDLRCQLP